MKLFTTVEQRTAAEERQEKDINRAIAIRDALETLLKQQAEAERSFEQTLHDQQDIWAEQDRLRAGRKHQLERDIEELEERKERLAANPITVLQESPYTGEKGLAEDLEAREEALMRRLDEVGEREQALEDKEVRLLLQEQGLASQTRDFLALMKRRK